MFANFVANDMLKGLRMFLLSTEQHSGTVETWKSDSKLCFRYAARSKGEILWEFIQGATACSLLSF